MGCEQVWLSSFTLANAACSYLLPPHSVPFSSHRSLLGCAGGLCPSWVPALGGRCPPLAWLTHCGLGWAQVSLWWLSEQSNRPQKTFA